jgi:hypothetical protein
MKRHAHWNPWGLVPADGDVVPFSTINPHRDGKGRSNKKHHYISITYMEGWTSASGRVWAYHPDQPSDPHPVQPPSIGYRNYYYSQTDEDGERDDHRWEDLWNCVETVWPATVRAVRDRRLSPAISFNLLGMVALQRARVPASRDRHELLMAHKLRTEVKALETIGKLPDDLQLYAGRLDEVPVGINPQRSLAEMRGDILENGDLAFRLGFEVLHNRTGTPFLTTDNPVCVYDPRQPVHARIPYAEADEIELLFPIDARMLLRGSTKLSPVNSVIRHRGVSDTAKVRKFNRTIAQFGYRLYIGQDRSSDALVAQYAAIVPTVQVEVRQKDDTIRSSGSIVSSLARSCPNISIRPRRRRVSLFAWNAMAFRAGS